MGPTVHTSADPTEAPANCGVFKSRLSQLKGGDSVRSFARKTGLSDTFIHKLLSGTSEPTLSSLQRIASACGVTVPWLIGEDQTLVQGESDPEQNVEPRRAQPVPSSETELGTRIGAVADKLGSRTHAADVAGISTDQLARYINGTSQPTLAPIARLCAAAKVSIDAVWSGADTYPAAPPAQPAAMQAREAPARAGFPAHVVEAAVEALETALQTLRIPMPPDKRAQAVVMLCRLAELMSADEMRRELREVAQQVARLAA